MHVLLRGVWIRATAIALVLAATAMADEGRTLRVGMATNYPPIAYAENGQATGLEVDLAQRLGAALQMPVEFRQLEFSGLIPALEKGEIDVIMSGMSVTDERAARVAFVDPYLRVGQMALIRAEDIARFIPADHLMQTKATVGFVGGTTGEKLVRGKFSTSDQKRSFDGTEAGVAALRQGEIDIFVHDAPTIWAVSMNPRERELLALYEPLTEEYLAWAVRKDDPDLKAAMDGVVEEWKRTGQLEPIVSRWIPVRVELKAKTKDAR